LSGLWLAAGPVASICPIASGDSSTSSSHHSPDWGRVPDHPCHGSGRRL